MEHNFKELFCDGSVLVNRYELTDGLISHVQLFYEKFIEYNNIDEDIEVLIPCILLVLQIHYFGIDIGYEIAFMASVFFDKVESNQRQMNVFKNYGKLMDHHLQYRW